MASQRLIETVFCLATILMAVLFLLQVVLLKESVHLEGYTVRAVISNVGALKPGADIRLGGVPVGSVATIDLDAERYVGILTLTIQSNLQLPNDSQLRVTTNSFLSKPFLELTLGGSDQPLIPKGGYIRRVVPPVNMLDSIGRSLFGSISSRNTGEVGG